MFYLINKPIGISSFDVIRKLRKLLGTRKIGHTGTLDPLATGCLLIATDNSTKLIPMLEKLEKTYTFSLRIDGTTPSLDLGTEITYHSTEEMNQHSESELVDFLYRQHSQTPPLYSALKVDGIRSYERARKGEKIKLKERPIEIKNVEISHFSPPEFEISLRISSGGYIRSLAESIGQFFLLPGGYITVLRRDTLHIAGSPLCLDDAQSLEDFDSGNHISYEKLFPLITSLEINDVIQLKLEQGRILSGEDISGVYNIGQKLFLKYGTQSISLIEYTSNGFQIIRNNV